MPTLKTKFGLGQIVWVVDDDWTPNQCPTCRGTKQVAIGGEYFICPKCHGNGTMPQPEDEYLQLAYEATVTEIHARHGGSTSFLIRLKEGAKLRRFGNISCAESDLFATEEEAQALAGRLNQGILVHRGEKRL